MVGCLARRCRTTAVEITTGKGKWEMKKLTLVLGMTLTALTLFAAGSATAGTGGPPLRSCGQIPTGAVWTVKATPGVGCQKARKVIKASGFGERSIALGF